MANSWISSIGGIIGLIGGVVGSIGGIVGLWSALRPPKIGAAHMDRLGVVISTNRTTSEVHLPLVLSNFAKKPGVVTFLRLSMRPIEGGQTHEYKWGLFWQEDAQGNRTPDRRPAPVPVPGYTCAQLYIQFENAKTVQWKPQPYEFTLNVRIGRQRETNEISRFYTRPSKDRCNRWYQGSALPQATVDDIPIFQDPDDVPMNGV